MADSYNESGGSDIDVEIAGQKVNVKNVKSLNTIVTLLTFALCCVGAYALWNHQADAKAASAEFVNAIREQTGVMRESAKLQREQNCLMSLPAERRDADLCKRLSQ